MTVAEAVEVSNMLLFEQTLIYHLLCNMKTCYMWYSLLNNVLYSIVCFLLCYIAHFQAFIEVAQGASVILVWCYIASNVTCYITDAIFNAV